MNIYSRTFLIAMCVALMGVGCADGADGKNGVDGQNGIDGQDGTDGTDGVDGADGEDGQGMNGMDGMNGTDGMNGMDGNDGTNGVPGFARQTIYLSNNGPANAGAVDRLDESFGFTRTFAPGNNEGIAFSRAGHLVQAGDTAAGHSIRTFCAPEYRQEGDAFDLQRDRAIAGAAAGLVNPKGFVIAKRAGYIFVANFNATNIQVFGTAAAGNVAPVATTTLSVKPWDVDYDEVNDRLFVALTDGTVAVFDDYVAGGFANTADRTITIANAVGMQQSVNMHGIVYDRAGDRLVLSDVGSAADATDGAIFVVKSASSADGNVEPSRTIKGPATLLGNPVDIILTGSDLRVAEKAQDYLLVFTNIFDGESGDIAPKLALPSVKPESLATYPTGQKYPDVTDVAASGLSIPYVTVSSNPGPNNPTTGQIYRLNSALGFEVGAFDASINLESVNFDGHGDVYATFDDGATAGGGIFIGNRVATHRDGETATDTRDRTITGPATKLVTPKGLDVASAHGLVFVAEFNATTPAVLVFSTCATGDVAPLATVDTAGARPWDVDYDVVTDKLFVAFTNGTIGVYDQFLADMGAGGPDRLITPGDANVKISVNIHGIDYDPGTDSLIVSDVGSAADPTDGQIFVIPGASTAKDIVQVTVQIGGPNSNLGNPVDISYDGRNLFVAEKSNDVIMRFDDILSSPGGDVAATLSYSVTKPESVVLNPGYFRAWH